MHDEGIKKVKTKAAFKHRHVDKQIMRVMVI